MFSFFKSQTVSIISTAVDFLITILLKELLGLPYLCAHSAGMISGGCTQFTLNRKWTFQQGNANNRMILRFLLVWMGNFILNTASVYFLNHFFHWDFLISKIVAAIVMATTINFFLQKEYVFK